MALQFLFKPDFESKTKELNLEDLLLIKDKNGNRNGILEVVSTELEVKPLLGLRNNFIHDFAFVNLDLVNGEKGLFNEIKGIVKEYYPGESSIIKKAREIIENYEGIAYNNLKTLFSKIDLGLVSQPFCDRMKVSEVVEHLAVLKRAKFNFKTYLYGAHNHIRELLKFYSIPEPIELNENFTLNICLKSDKMEHAEYEKKLAEFKESLKRRADYRRKKI